MLSYGPSSQTAWKEVIGMMEEGRAFVWAYLSKRKQRIKLSGCMSDWLDLLKCGPQGSILGPVFFNIVMNHILCDYNQSVTIQLN